MAECGCLESSYTSNGIASSNLAPSAFMFKKFNFSNLVAAVSIKADGPMGLSYEIQDKAEIRNRRERFLKKFGVGLNQLVSGKLVHGNTVTVVKKNNAGSVIQDSDGLVTGDKNIFLSITIADCLPIFYFDPVHEAVGLAHAGWRGITKEIPVKVVEVMRENFGSEPKDLIAGVGPHICAQHYEVKSDVSSQFQKYEGGVLEREGKLFLDLGRAVKSQLLSQGVKEENIEISPECTFELKDTYYSARRDKPENLETMMTVIGFHT